MTLSMGFNATVNHHQHTFSLECNDPQSSLTRPGCEPRTLPVRGESDPTEPCPPGCFLVHIIVDHYRGGCVDSVLQYTGHELCTVTFM